MLAFIDEIVIPFLNTLYGAVGYVEVLADHAMAPAQMRPGRRKARIELEGLFDEFAEAQALDPRRARAIAAAADVDPASLPFDHLLSIVFLDDVLLDTSPEAGNRLLVAIQRAEPSSAADPPANGRRPVAIS